MIQRLMKMDSSKKLLESGRILELFFQLTLENRDTKMGEVLREFVPEDAIFAYYKAEFTADKDWLSKEKVREFLELGFGLEELARLLVTDQDGRRMQPQDFFDMLLEMQLHVEKKETYDVTRGDMTNSTPDDIQMLMTRAFGKMLGFGNRNVDAYYPLEEIVQRCKTVMSHFCDVDEMLRGALDRNRERRETLDSPVDSLQHFFHEEGGGFSQMVELYQQKQDELEQYDIKNMEEIVYYENGDAIAPEVEQVLRETFEALHSFTDGFEDFKKLNKYGREGFFIHRNRHILIQEETWERIFERIMDDDYIQRFYAFSIVNMTSQQICDRMEAILSNLELLDDYWDSTSGTDDCGETPAVME
ncbi:MAG: hypothetical protein LUI87_17925 [Lachnospiraceae bacterium]|nr:hypothetical protein [Lachnospiraceae bacterium]